MARVYPQIPGQNETDDQRSEYLREFFANLMGGEQGVTREQGVTQEQGVPQGVFYNLDSDTSDTSGDSGNQSIVLD